MISSYFSCFIGKKQRKSLGHSKSVREYPEHQQYKNLRLRLRRNFFFMILSFFALEMHYFLMIFVLFTHILPPYKEGNGNLISGEKRVPLFMLSHIAQKGDFGAFKRRKTIVFGDPLFFFRPASAKFYEEFFLPTYLLILFFLFFVSFRKFFFFSFNIRLLISFLWIF